MEPSFSDKSYCTSSFDTNRLEESLTLFPAKLAISSFGADFDGSDSEDEQSDYISVSTNHEDIEDFITDMKSSGTDPIVEISKLEDISIYENKYTDYVNYMISTYGESHLQNEEGIHKLDMFKYIYLYTLLNQ